MPGRSQTASAHAWVLDSKGGAREASLETVRRWEPGDGYLWVDWEEEGEAAFSWFREESSLGSRMTRQLLESGLWSRVASPDPKSLLVILHLSTKPDGESGDNANVLRFWMEPHRLFSIGVTRTLGLSHIQRRFQDSTGPRGPAELLLFATEPFASNLADSVMELRSRLTQFDLMVENDESLPLDNLRRIRRVALEWQRYAEPIRDALIRIRSLGLDWLDTGHHRWPAAIDFFDDGTDALDSVVAHSRALHEFLEHRTAEQVNTRLYILTLLTAILMPVSIVVDIFGANISTRLGNILGADEPLWFGAYLALILVTGWIVYVVIRRKLG